MEKLRAIRFWVRSEPTFARKGEIDCHGRCCCVMAFIIWSTALVITRLPINHLWSYEAPMIFHKMPVVLWNLSEMTTLTSDFIITYLSIKLSSIPFAYLITACKMVLALFILRAFWIDWDLLFTSLLLGVNIIVTEKTNVAFWIIMAIWTFSFANTFEGIYFPMRNIT